MHLASKGRYLEGLWPTVMGFMGSFGGLWGTVASAFVGRLAFPSKSGALQRPGEERRQAVSLKRAGSRLGPKGHKYRNTEYGLPGNSYVVPLWVYDKPFI